MGTITGKFNLTALKHVMMEKKGQSGMVKGIFIPVEANDLFASEKGNVYLDVICFDSVNDEYKQTHAVKQSFKKDKYTKEELKEKPYLGHLNTKFGGGGEPSANNASPGVVVGENDDLPF